MIAIRDLDHLVLRVVDLAKMEAFYTGVLGCTVARRRDDLGLVQLKAGRSMLDLVPVDGKLGQAGGAAPGREGRNLDHFCFRVEPWDETAIRARLARFGTPAEDTSMRFGAEGKGPSIYTRDPEGNVVELKGPASSDFSAALAFAAPVLRVSELPRSLAFYQNKLGFALEFDYEGIYASVIREGCRIHLSCGPGPSRDQAAFEREEGIDLCLGANDATALATALAAAGVSFTVPLRQMPYGKEFYVRDPDGYILGFVQPAGGG